MNYWCNRVQKLYAKWKKEEIDCISWDEFYKQNEKRELNLYKYAKALHSKSKEEEIKTKVFMITIRPKDNMVAFETFKADVELFISELPFKEVEYCYEQKGESLEELGKGFHTHIVFSTDKVNYWQSHILRDAKKKKYGFLKYTKANCIQVDKVICEKRAREYIRGIKNDEEKELSCQFDEVWRKQLEMVTIFREDRSSP